MYVKIEIERLFFLQDAINQNENEGNIIVKIGGNR